MILNDIILGMFVNIKKELFMFVGFNFCYYDNYFGLESEVKLKGIVVYRC